MLSLSKVIKLPRYIVNIFNVPLLLLISHYVFYLRNLDHKARINTNNPRQDLGLLPSKSRNKGGKGMKVQPGHVLQRVIDKFLKHLIFCFLKYLSFVLYVVSVTIPGHWWLLPGHTCLIILPHLAQEPSSFPSFQISHFIFHTFLD